MARTIAIQILGDATSLERSFKKAGAASESFGRQLGVSFKGLAKAGAVGAAAGGVALVTKQLGASVKAAKDAEAAAARLEGAFKSAGVAAEDRQRAQVAINRVSKAAALDDEDLSDVLAKLTRTTGSAKKGMEGIALAANIARARNIKLSSAANIVEKAHTGQLRGLKAVGVAIDKNTSTTEALERAQRKFAGSAETYGRTAAGAQDKLNVAFENLQERVGAKLLPVITKFMLKLVDLIDWTERNWPRIAKAIEPAVRVVKHVFERLTRITRDWFAGVRAFVRLIDALVHGKWSKAWDAFKDVVSNALKVVYRLFLDLPVRIAKALGSKAWDGLKAIGTTIKNAALGGLKGLADGLVSALKHALQRVIDLVKRVYGPFRGVFGKVGIDLPKIPDVIEKSGAGARRAGARSGARAGVVPSPVLPPRFGNAQSGSQPFTIVVAPTLQLDGREVGRLLTGQQQRAVRNTAVSRRGPHAGGGPLGLG